MNEFDDDLLISGAFRDFQRAAEPSVRPAGSSAVRGLAVQRRRARITMLSVVGALVIAVPVATYAALDQDNQGPPVLPAGTSTSPSPPEKVEPSPIPSASPSPPVLPPSASTSPSPSGKVEPSPIPSASPSPAAE
jgi:hypothetical protein